MASIDKVTICNMALSRVGGRSKIEAIDEASTEADACELWYDYSLRQVLEASDWNFARKRLTLSTHSDDPPDGIWGYRYQYPSDCVAFRKLENPSDASADAVPFQIETSLDGQQKTIVTDLDDAVGVYTFEQTVTSTYSAHFVSLLSLALATNIAFQLTGKQKIQDTLAQRLRDALDGAASSDANEEVGKAPREAEWIRDRK